MLFIFSMRENAVEYVSGGEQQVYLLWYFFTFIFVQIMFSRMKKKQTNDKQKRKS